ncbi:vWA domain-containing protein [Paraliomyxa miuraensis]|uniref:vWA domain-containing protein n=1 Tax=Paraliomyxa miuraensis TaxID=376150 RepID=UPI00225BA1DA|nr:VWA domain-containing protein [Paraliomyxa miuraensis]MCX4241465.1 VWA domain-containing protein [Paraliomyxa miuraensis]
MNATISRTLSRTLAATAAALCLSTLPACSGDDGSGGPDGGPPPGEGDDGSDPGSGQTPLAPGVGQGGAQDFGQFRAILEAGGIPGPQTLDDVGFFNEHKIELPAADCGDDVCLHAELGVAGNMLSGSNCTLVLLGMNTPIDPSRIERPPLHLTVAVDTSGSMDGAPIEHVREGLLRMAEGLRAEDRVSLVGFGDVASVLADDLPGDSAQLQVAIASLGASGSTNLYDGLRTAYEVSFDRADLAEQNRVLLLSDGQATTGLLGDDRLVELATDYAIEGIGLSTVGMGLEFDPTLMRSLAERGGGAFYFLEDHAAVEEVFEEEAAALLLPLASEVEIDVDVASGYRLRAVYGTKLATVGAGAAHLSIPSLHLAHRESVGDTEGGRRGGGGAIVVELLAEPGAVPDDERVGTLTLRYRVPGTDEDVVQEERILSSLAPGQTPAEGLFDDAGVEKAFVTLNLYMGFAMAAERAEVGDDASALNLLQILHRSVSQWLETHPDADIEDDLRYVLMFIDNLMARGAAVPPGTPTPEPWPQD